VLEVLAELPALTPVVGSLVWVRVLDEDSQQATQLAADQLADPHLVHFYDPQQRAAREMAVALGGTGSYAWDTYLVFSPGVTWRVAAPQPSDWVHQLDNVTWAPAQRRKKGEALINALQTMIQQA